MGKASRERPRELAEKLLRIREAFAVSQSEMAVMLGVKRKGYRSYISEFETGKREPPLPVLLAYAGLAGVYVDVLISDKLDLPDKIPALPKSEGVSRTRSKR
jgi:transcriptional regulator with XRE-family HTH domain